MWVILEMAFARLFPMSLDKLAMRCLPSLAWEHVDTWEQYILSLRLWIDIRTDSSSTIGSRRKGSRRFKKEGFFLPHILHQVSYCLGSLGICFPDQWLSFKVSPDITMSSVGTWAEGILVVLHPYPSPLVVGPVSHYWVLEFYGPWGIRPRQHSC